MKTRFTFVDTEFKPQEDEDREIIILGFEKTPKNIAIVKALFGVNPKKSVNVDINPINSSD